MKSSVLLFVDDCVLYSNIHFLQDLSFLQEDLDSLAVWEADCQMQFNVDKCHYESGSALFTQTYSHRAS